jgi:hypothetical protein
LEDLFKKGHWFVERVSDQKWLTAMVNPVTLKEEDWTNDPNKAMSFTNKPLAELEIIRMKLGDSAIATEHEFVSKELINGWIDVKNQTPEYGKWCLLFSWRGIIIGSYFKDRYYAMQITEPGIQMKIEDVTHWQPLPGNPNC